MKMALILLTHAFAWSCFAQTKLKDRKIDLEVKDVTFETLINKLRKEHQINIVYGVDRLGSLDQKISIKAANITLSDLMTVICKHYNLSVEFLNSYVVLNPGEPKRQSAKASRPEIATARNVEPKINNADTTQMKQATEIAVISVVKDPEKDSVISIEVVEKRLPDNTRRNEVTVSALKRKRIRHFITAFSSLDVHRYNFKSLADPNQEYTAPVTVGYALTYSRSISDHLRLALGTQYASKEFRYNRNFKILDADEPVSIPNITTLSYRYVEVPVEVGYQLIRSRYVSVIVLSGVNAAFLISKKETTQFLTNGDPDTKYFIHDTNTFLFGASAGIRFSVNIYRGLSFFCEPRYIKYFKPLNLSVMNSGPDLFRANSGIALQLNHSNTR
jgi:hypothetical protein